MAAALVGIITNIPVQRRWKGENGSCILSITAFATIITTVIVMHLCIRPEIRLCRLVDMMVVYVIRGRAPEQRVPKGVTS